MSGVTTIGDGRGTRTFVDAEGMDCSMNDSSLAGDACIWLGVDRTEGGKGTNRMHLTLGMTRRVAREMQRHADGTSVEGPVDLFTDRSGSQCAIECTGRSLLVGVITGFEGNVGMPMTLTREMCRDLLPFLVGFLQNGHLTTGDDMSALKEPPETPIHDTVPADALRTTGIGDTGVAVGDLLDAFLRLYRYVELDDAVGRDEAVRIESMSSRLEALKR